MPALAEGFSDRPDTARGILDALTPGSTIALVPGSEFAEGKQNWLGASGKTQIAVMLAETLWRSGSVYVVVWISATWSVCSMSSRMASSSPPLAATRAR